MPAHRKATGAPGAPANESTTVRLTLEHVARLDEIIRQLEVLVEALEEAVEQRFGQGER